VLPRPPLPACTLSRASSTNFILGPFLNKNPGGRRGFGDFTAKSKAP
jgi:hypothetical protein